MNYIVISEDVRSAQELITCAKAQGASEITAVQFDAPAAETVAKSGATKVVVANVAAGTLREAVADVVVDLAKEAGEAVVLTGATRRMVNAAAAIAAALGTAPVVDVKALTEGGASHIKFGGKIVVTEKPVGPYGVYVMAVGAYEAAAADGAACPVEAVEVTPQVGVRVVELKAKETPSVDLTAAKTIVCVGRGVNAREGFEQCVALQRALHGEMACTRPVTETEDPFMPRETYIGASGLTVKPDLFISVAASGQTQHTMGMYESGKVVVIDKNKDALFFNMCDYGIVGDYNEIVPAITRALGA